MKRKSPPPIPFRPAKSRRLPDVAGEEVEVKVDLHAYRVRLLAGGDPLLFDPHEAIEVGCMLVRRGVRLLELTNDTAKEE
jgi:hypothetical protein